jgi:uncharacterized protein with GYD domain
MMDRVKIGFVDVLEARAVRIRPLVNFYFTTGDTDFLIITEGDDAESIIASLLATAAAGTISDISTGRAWTGKEFKAVADKASKAAKAYRAPGKH